MHILSFPYYLNYVRTQLKRSTYEYEILERLKDVVVVAVSRDVERRAGDLVIDVLRRRLLVDVDEDVVAAEHVHVVDRQPPAS